MDPQVSASFIPKKPLAETHSPSGGAYGLVLIVSLLFFVTSLFAAGGAFLYGQVLTKSLTDKKASLVKYQESYQLETIQTLVRFDSRIKESQKILQKHLSPSAIFAFLSEQTLEKVRFTGFEYSLSGADHAIQVSLSGVADSFATIALQSDQLGHSKYLRDVIFSNIAVGQGGKVTFSVNAKVDPGLILYSNNLANGQFNALAPSEEASSSQATP